MSPLPFSPSVPLLTSGGNQHRAKAIWDFEGIYCTSRHLPHVKFAGLIHPGILGCAPSAEVLATWNKREGELISSSKLEGRDVALPPQPFSAHAGASDAALAEKVGKEGARTVPGRPEHGGNCEYVVRFHSTFSLPSKGKKGECPVMNCCG